jgi:hypothetical protein
MMTESELMRSGKMVAIQANSLAYAMVVRDVLEGAGIAASLNYETIHLNPDEMQDVSGEVEVTVPQPDFDLALSLLFDRPVRGELFWVSTDRH